MLNLDKKEINFIGKRKIFFAISIALILISCVAVVARGGLNLSTDFTGGSTITYIHTASNTTEADVRSAIADAGYSGEAVVQTMSANGVSGFLAKITETDSQKAESIAAASAEKLGLTTSDIQTSTISANWGTSVMLSSLLALAIGMIAILIYIWIRFRDVKIGILAIVALLHDVAIVVGIYAALGLTIDQNAVSGLLAILGYGLYDGIVLFHSIKQNGESGRYKQNFWTITNHSINEVWRRSCNTTISSIVPVLLMLIFGGQTLTTFAAILLIGLICGFYSSFAIEAPLYAMWKAHELKVAEMNVKYGSKIELDTNKICKYDKGVDDIPAYIEERNAAAIA